MARATAGEAALTSKSLNDIALDKRIGSAGDTTAATATASTAGDLGVDITATPELNIQITTGPAGAPTSTTISASR
ncbi:hypothetical protein ABIE41_000102 [Bosea sp. OAE506]|uniref:hypothetical protein n=1 Tax=Bosea sp. OAE506 TaxID=2663870 RepID=UPI00178C07CA